MQLALQMITCHVQVFLSHLHSDHITDLGPLFALANGRKQLLTIYGPSGAEPETGTAAVIDGLSRVSMLIALSTSIVLPVGMPLVWKCIQIFANHDVPR